jgi:hypothetical protein
MVVRTRGHPLSFQDIYLVPRSSPFIYRPTSSAASSPRSAPSGPLVIGPGVGRPSRGRPPTGQIWVWRNIWVWRKSSSRCPTQHPAHADGPPPPLLPAPPSASRPRRPPLNRQLAGCPPGRASPPARPGWLTGIPPLHRRPGWRAAAAHRARRHAGRGLQHAPAIGPPAWPEPSRLTVPLLPRPPRMVHRRSQPPSRAPLARWLLASLYTHRPQLGGEMASKPSSLQKIFLGTPLTM